jgi:prefoldin subunit 5
MKDNKATVQQLQDGMEEMEASIERLREEIQRLMEQRDALEQGNLTLYEELTKPQF